MSEEYGVSPLMHCSAYAVAATRECLPLINGRKLTWVGVFEKGGWKVILESGEWQAQAKEALAKLEDPAFFKSIDEGQRRSAKEFEDYSLFLKREDFSSYSNAALYAAFDKLFSLNVELNVFGHVVNLPDFESNYLSDRLTAILDAKLLETGASTTVAQAFNTLVTPNEKSLMQKQDEDFLLLLRMAQENDGLQKTLSQDAYDHAQAKPCSFPEFQNALQAHVEKYDWMQFHYDGPVILDEAYFLGLLKSELKQGDSASAKLSDLKRKEKELKENQERLVLQLRLGEKEVYWFGVAKTFSFLKGLRKDAVFLSARCAERLYGEMGRRLGLSVRQVKHMTRAELKGSLQGASVSKALLDTRIDSCVLLTENGVEQILVGKKIGESLALVEEKSAVGVNELKGTPACPGFARGVVKLVAKSEDMAKMNQGDILISPATNPNLVPAMKKAAAIVTNEGGITCHAAIVSRELGIPCVVGTKIVTRAFKDGDVVEVDANKGLIRRVS